MSDDGYDVIVVGAGVAGSTAAYVMAKAGLAVLLLERGDTAGSKNLTGGRLYTHSLEKIMPGFAETAPLQRRVVRESLSMLTSDSAVTMDYHDGALPDAGRDSYTVLRAEFDEWLAEQAETAGCDLATGVRVDDLIRENGRIKGVIADEDELEAQSVILADGVNSLLAQRSGFKKELQPSQVAVGVKEIIKLPIERINDRFGLTDDQGAARLFVGNVTNGIPGGGFLYTNRDSVSLGLVVNVEAIAGQKEQLPQIMEDFKSHPEIAPLITGGQTVEYAAHLVPEAGLAPMPQLYNDGALMVGDAAGLVINAGYLVRGMDLAIASGEAAAQTVIDAKEKGDFSRNSMKAYQGRLENSFVLKDLETYRNAPSFLESKRLYNVYPELAANIMSDLFRVDIRPALPLYKKIVPRIWAVGLIDLLGDAWKGIRAL